MLVTHYSRALWWDLAKQVGFHAIDTNGDGVLCRKEVEAATRVRLFVYVRMSIVILLSMRAVSSGVLSAK